MRMTRRKALSLLGAGAGLPFLPVPGLMTPARAQAGGWHHGLSLFGDLKYGPDFKHFDYVDPNAPKGGRLRMATYQPFDSLNVVPPRGSVAPGVGLIYDSLMISSLDESSAEYGLVADGAEIADDISWVTYRLREGGRWHDGEPITPADVLFSFDALKTHHPLYHHYYQNVVKAEQTGDREVTFTFDQTGNRELPNIVGQITVLPKHYWDGKDAKGNPRDITKTTLDVPLGSGAYRIKQVIPGRTIVYERVPDYWGAELPVNIGRNNLDEIRYEVYRDLQVAFEAFKADALDFFVEATSKNWVSGYDFPAVKRGDVVQEAFPQMSRATGRLQAWVFNLRRKKFQDRRVRRAFNLALDFETMNETFFYGLYERIDSYFDGTELAATGVPEGLELEILEKVRDKVPEALFTEPYENPVGGSPKAVRRNLREALKLLEEAGWVVKNRRLVNAETGEPFTVQFLSDDPRSERTVGFYKKNLERLGMDVSLRVVDSSQYQNRLRSFDFDIISVVKLQSLSPGNEQRNYWGSESADVPGSDNEMGIENPAVDYLIDRIIYADNREELVAATHALDRVLLWNDYVVPQWISGEIWTARWNRYSHPDPLPEYSFGFPSIWWYDKDKAAAIGGEG